MTHAVMPRAILAAILAVGVSASAMAQEKKPAAPAAKPATPAAAPAAAAPAAAAPAAGAPAAGAPAADAKPQSAWVKLCEQLEQKTKDKDGKETVNKKNICLTHHERLNGENGMVIVSAALREIEGNDKKQFMIMVPLGMAIPPGLRAAVYSKEIWAKAAKNETFDDKLLKPFDLKFSLCHPGGCTAEIEATPEMIESMKTGGGIMVLALNAAVQPVPFPIPLDGFNEALTGKPVNNEEYAKARGELMGRIREMQIERMNKYKEEQMKLLPPAPGGAAAPAAAAAAPTAAAPEKKK